MNAEKAGLAQPTTEGRGVPAPGRGKWGIGRVLPQSLFARFTLMTVVGTLALGLVLTSVFNGLLHDSAIQRARASTSGFIHKQATTHLRPDLFQGQPSPDTVATFERFFREEIASPEILRIKVWDAGARVIYSDEPTLVGERFPDNQPFVQAMRGDPAVSIKAPLEEENRFEKGYGQLMEVYVPITFRDGDSPAGVIEVYYILDQLNQDVAQFRQVVFFLLVASLLAAAVAHLGFFRQLVTAPLGRLGAFALDVGRGNLTGRLRLARRDEIGRLAGGPDAMGPPVAGPYRCS